MEDILEKNIFSDIELVKFSPDYCPSALILRMQMRRSLVKDSHTHRINRKYLQRKNSSKKVSSSNDSKINKEIVKLKDTYETENINNEVKLKNTKSLNLRKHKLALNKLNDAIDSNNGQDFDTRLPENVTHVQDYERKTSVPRNGKTLKQSNVYNIDNITQELNGMRIFVPTEDFIITEEDKVIDSPTQTNKNITKTDDIFKDPVADLQSLLIRMAIFSNPEDDDEGEKKNAAIDNEEMNTCDSEVHYTQSVFEPLGIAENKDLLKIQPLRIKYKVRDKYLVTKYLLLWKAYISRKKEHVTEERQKALQYFFEKLDKKKNELSDPACKAKLNVRDYNNYQHRYKVQKHIIALQKAKLDEQNRLIEELKYNKIVEASRNSVEAMRDEVRRTYFEIDRHLKPKIKCLTNELKIPEIEEPSLVLHCLKVPQFLQRMEKRAREREEKHALIRERRIQMEEERIRLKQQVELAKAEMDKEEKMKRMKELKEKRKREKIDNIRKKHNVERMRALTVMAELHYEKNILLRCGLHPWKVLLQMKRENMEKAKAYCRFQIVKNAFLHWMWYTEDMWYERYYKAEDFYRKTILRKHFDNLKKNHREYVLKRQVAEDYYDFYIVKLVFRNFCLGIEEVKKEHALKWQRAVAYHNSNLQFKTFTCWRSLPALNALKREQEARKARWREKVLLVVPDYTPPED